jgi:hypothetical protein
MDYLKEGLSRLFDKYGNVTAVIMAIRNNLQLMDSLKEITSFLPSEIKISQRLYHVLNNIHDINKCKRCNKETTFRSFNQGYSDYCGSKCAGIVNSAMIKQNRLEDYKLTLGKVNLVAYDELVKLFAKFGNINSVLGSVKGNLHLIDSLKESTPFLSPDVNVSQRIWHIMNNVSSISECKFCGNETNFRNYNKGYLEFCSPKCASLGTRDKSKETCLKNYGVENPSQSKEVQETYKQTCLERYGVENPRQLPEVIAKSKETMLERYGVESYSQTDEYKEQIKQTSLERYGTENPNQSPIVREKYVHTCEERYGVTNTFQLTKQEDRDQAFMDKYGVKNPFQIPEVREQAKHTNLERYGFENAAKSPDVQEKISKSVIEYYQDHDNPFLGKHHTEETKHQMSASAIVRLMRDGVNNMYYGKHLNQGYFYSAKSDEEIYHNSSYELRAYQLLEVDEKVKFYDRCKFCIKYFNPRVNGIRRYLPDIHIIYANDGSQEIIEVKPDYLVNDPINQAKFKSAIPYCNERGWKFSIWTEKELKIGKFKNS